MLVLTSFSTICHTKHILSASPFLRTCVSLGHLCHAPVHAVLGGTIGLGNSVTDTPLSTQSSQSSCGNVEEKDESSADDGDQAWEVPEGSVREPGKLSELCLG